MHVHSAAKCDRILGRTSRRRDSDNRGLSEAVDGNESCCGKAKDILPKKARAIADVWMNGTRFCNASGNMFDLFGDRGVGAKCCERSGQLVVVFDIWCHLFFFDVTSSTFAISFSKSNSPNTKSLSYTLCERCCPILSLCTLRTGFQTCTVLEDTCASRLKLSRIQKHPSHMVAQRWGGGCVFPADWRTDR